MKIIAILLCISLFSGCTTIQDAKSSRGSGKFETYAYDYNQVWEASVSVVEKSKLDLISQNKKDGEILAQKGMSAFSYGENVAVFLDQVSEKSTKVEVVSKRALQTTIVAKNWSNYILENIKELLSEVKAVDESQKVPLSKYSDKATENNSVYDKLEVAHDLHSRGILTDTEFEAEKKKLLENQ